MFIGFWVSGYCTCAALIQYYDRKEYGLSVFFLLLSAGNLAVGFLGA
jgi:hypothetical protein